ncbi:hypothetical protein [Laceyella putida]|uniref:SPOR domain-containing protein n=1 Tax=Laceyella putida TaxID=110101 RepID=A0ABW2RIF2_9BACL
MEYPKPRISSHQSGMKVTIQPHPESSSPGKAGRGAEGQAIAISKRQERINGQSDCAGNQSANWEKIEKTPISAAFQQEEGRRAKKSAVTQVWEERSFAKSFTDNKQHVIEWSSPNNPFLQKRLKIRPPAANLGQLLLSIAAAILVGLVMGFSILRIFFLENAPHSARSIDDHLPKTNVVAEKPLIDQKGVGNLEKEVRNPLPSLRVVMLQAGHFQTKLHAQKKVQEYRTQGLAAVMSDHPPYRIFLGLGLTRDDALKLSAIYQKKEVEVYLKEWRMVGQMPKGMKKKEKLAQLLEGGNRLIQQLGNASIANIQSNPVKEAPAFAFQTTWKKEYRQILTDFHALEKELPPKLKTSLSQCIAALDLAIQSGETANKHPNQVLLWQIQEGLVRYALAYERVVGAMVGDEENKF